MSLRLLLGGDLMLGRAIDQCMATHCPPELHEPVVHDARQYVRLAECRHGPIPRPMSSCYPWGSARQSIAQLAPDLRIVNLETAITTASEAWPEKAVHYRMHPANTSLLSCAGLDACSLANNHVLDWGSAGLAETLGRLQACGIRTVGAGLTLRQAICPACLPRPDGGRLLLFAWALASSGVPADWAARENRPGVAWLGEIDPAMVRQMATWIDQNRQPGDRVILSLHWGANWVSEVPASHGWLARQLIDQAGVDLVMGHSSHHPLPPAVHADRLILFGCGDLINDYEGIPVGGGRRSDLVCLYLAELECASGALLSLTIVPFALRRFQLTEPLPVECGELSGVLKLHHPPAGWRVLWKGSAWELKRTHALVPVL